MDMSGYSKVAALILNDWAVELAAHLGRTEQQIRAHGLSATDYPNEIVEVQFADDSTASYRFAFALVSPEKNAIGVFSGRS